MGRIALLLAVLSGLPARGQEAPVLQEKPYACRPLEFELKIPEGWQAEQDRTGIVVRDARMGFLVSREPFLHDESSFAAAWGRRLGDAGLDTRVVEGKAGSYVVYHAAWASDAENGRSIQAWRVYVPDIEMIYNFSFSAPKGTELRPLVEPVLKSFRCTAPKPKLELTATPEPIGPRVTIRLPKGYTRVPQGIRLGGGAQIGWVKKIDGYEEPHVAGTIGVRGADPRINLKSLVDGAWAQAQAEFGKIVKKPRTRSARYGILKGHGATASAVSKKGIPKRFFAFAGKVKQAVLVITFVVDEREVRLHKDLFKRVCESLELKE